MATRRTVAYLLIAIGTITLLARLSDGAAWLWIGLVAAAALAAYSRGRIYGFLVLGGILAGTAVGILLQELFRVEALFLVSLGAGIAAVDIVEPRSNRWPRTLGAILAILGAIIGLSQAGAFTSVWFALLLVALGVALLVRRDASDAFPPPLRADLAGDSAVNPRLVRLEAWRSRTAEAEGRAPQEVLPDATLEALARSAPADLVSLATTPGVDTVAAERYGAALVEVLRRDRA
jgi:hypothetical protein